MRSVIFAAALAVGLSLPAIASAGKFGGFSSDGSKYLDGDAKVCTPLSAAKGGAAVGAPQCTVVTDKKKLSAYAFRRPKVDTTVSATATGKKLEVTVESATIQWDAANEITAVGDAFLDGKMVAVEYTASTLRGTTTNTIAFAISGTADAQPIEKPKDPPPEAKPAKPVKGSSYDRAMAKGGVWEQTLVQCDQARVTLTLKKNMKYNVRVETRCQGDKSVATFGGKWIAEGTHGVVLQLANDDGNVEQIACQLGESDDEPTIHCSDEDVEFTMKPVKR